VAVALATDCNPGTCYSSSMPFVLALAVREMHLTPAEALRAATVGSATSLRRNDIGRIAPGMRADLTVLDAPSYLHLSYRAGVPISRALELASD
jgi:imidazolonepropionase